MRFNFEKLLDRTLLCLLSGGGVYVMTSFSMTLRSRHHYVVIW